MTERLYYNDAYLRTFDARVIARVQHDGRPAVILDRSAFYPEGGGQPSDRGTLDRVPVLDVIERESDGEVLHVLAEMIDRAEVTGTLDAARRFDLMQQHTGQHILSEAFLKLADAATMSFHLNPDAIDGALTIDVDTTQITPDQVDRVEDLANAIVFENRPVTARFVTDEELRTLPLRKPPKVDGAIRIVEIEDFDWSACGGTHVARTGEVGLIKILKLERRGGATRVEFRCGQRALIDYRRKHAMVSKVASDLSTGFWELDQTIARIQAEGKAGRKQLAEAEAHIQHYEARELLSKAVQREGYGLITQVWPDRDAAYIKRMANLLIAQPRTVALLGASGKALALVFARSKDLTIDLASLLKATASQLGGKGGGSPDFAQAGGPAASEAQLQEAIEWAVQQVAPRG
jgi:alanyl-tRNA synthetase